MVNKLIYDSLSMYILLLLLLLFAVRGQGSFSSGITNKGSVIIFVLHLFLFSGFWGLELGWQVSIFIILSVCL